MKKQLYRVKQLADQTFLRTGKSEQLDDELQAADRRVEHFKETLASIAKKLNTAGSFGQGQDPLLYEKRLKKYYEYQLGTVMQDCGTPSDENILRSVLSKTSSIEINLAREMAEHDFKVEQTVGTPIHSLLDNEIPNVAKVKRHLTKSLSEKETISNRYQTACKHVENQPKIECLREELEEAELKVDQAKDYFAIELFSVLKKEPEVAHRILQFVKLQRAFHESALHLLEEVVPDLEKLIVNSSVKSMYGVELEEHLRVTNRQIAFPLELCACILSEIGMEEEGLFRLSCGTLKLRRMKLSIDSQSFQLPLQAEYLDPHTVAGALKSYFRDLPEPLLGSHLYNQWLSIYKAENEQKRIGLIETLLSFLPVSYFENVRYLFRFLNELAKHPSNKMTAQNIAIVITPNLLWNTNDQLGLNNMSNATIMNSVIETLISNAETFFPGDFEVYVTLSKELLFRDSFDTTDSSIEILRRAASTNSLCDQSSPPKSGSPKPVVRRKNKPAPHPPVHLQKEEKGENKISEAAPNPTTEEKHSVPNVKPRTVIFSPMNQSLTDLSSIDENSVTLRLKRASVAAATSASSSASSAAVNGEKTKPAVPERPSIIRPSSFRIPRPHHDQPAADFPDFAYLERAAFFNVPSVKQQQQVAPAKKSPTDGHDSQLAEKEKFLMRTKPSIPSKPPPPPASTQRASVNGHSRTRSDGCLIDQDSTPKSNCDRKSSSNLCSIAGGSSAAAGTKAFHRLSRSQPPQLPPPPPPPSSAQPSPVLAHQAATEPLMSTSLPTLPSPPSSTVSSSAPSRSSPLPNEPSALTISSNSSSDRSSSSSPCSSSSLAAASEAETVYVTRSTMSNN